LARFPSALLRAYSTLEETLPAIPKDALENLLSEFNKLTVYSEVLKVHLEYLKIMVSSLGSVPRDVWRLEVILDILKEVKSLAEKLETSKREVEKTINKIASELSDACKDCEALDNLRKALENWEEWKLISLCNLTAEISSINKLLREKIEKYYKLENKKGFLPLQRDTHQRKGKANSAT